jgi:regulator of replication initiation timing
MATVAQLEQEIAAIEATLGQLQANKAAVLREIGALNVEKDELRAASRKQYQGGDQAGASELRSMEARVDEKIGDLYSGPAFKGVQEAEVKILQLKDNLYRVKSKEEFDAKQKQTASAATDVANSDAGATQNPATPPASTGRLTTNEAATLASNTETGTNAPVKTLAETQSVSPSATNSNAPGPDGRPGGEPGAGAAGDDGATAANTKQILAAVQATQSEFSPRNNVLDQYASYTYNIGWYLLTPEQYTALQETSKITVSQYNLLIQSGGAPASVEGVRPELTTGGAAAGVSKSAGRNPFFALDYYFDNLEIKSTITGKGSNRGHNAAELSFTVTEPAAITLIDNLWKAVKQVYPDPATYVAAIYALVIRFYGYDENGKIVQASDSDNKSAVVEKILPFRLTDIQFSVSNKLVEYQVKGAAVCYTVGFGSNLGVIKSDIQISGGTVKDLLTKGVVLADVSPADGRKTTSAPATPAAPAPAAKVSDLPVKQQAAIAAGTDYNLVTDDGMAFGGGGLTGA